MNKKFNVKFYDKNDVLLQTVHPKKILNEIQFSEKINGGQGELRLDLNASFDGFKDELNFLELMHHARIFEIDTKNKTGRVIFTGYVERYKSVLSSGEEKISVYLLGLVSVLVRVMIFIMR